jgi:Zn-dependent metalloprotease
MVTEVGTYFDVLTSIDVAAHEIGHAVCEKQQT